LGTDRGSWQQTPHHSMSDSMNFPPTWPTCKSLIFHIPPPPLFSLLLIFFSLSHRQLFSASPPPLLQPQGRAAATTCFLSQTTHKTSARPNRYRASLASPCTSPPCHLVWWGRHVLRGEDDLPHAAWSSNRSVLLWEAPSLRECSPCDSWDPLGHRRPRGGFGVDTLRECSP
jgi:hypothetical protein